MPSASSSGVGSAAGPLGDLPPSPVRLRLARRPDDRRGDRTSGRRCAAASAACRRGWSKAPAAPEPPSPGRGARVLDRAIFRFGTATTSPHHGLLARASILLRWIELVLVRLAYRGRSPQFHQKA